jgi:hypothetical protein
MLPRRVFILAAVPVATAVAVAAPAASADSKSDKAILKAGVVTRADVPADWTSSKASTTDRAFKVPECKEIRAAVDTAKRKAPRAQSRQFEEPGSAGTAFADSTVYAFANVDAATKLVAPYQSANAPTCFEAGTTKALSGTKAAGSPTVSPITDLQGVGDDAVGYEIQVPFTSGTESASLYLDFVVVRVGRAVIGFRFSNGDARLPEAPGIVQSVVQRVAGAEA